MRGGEGRGRGGEGRGGEGVRGKEVETERMFHRRRRDWFIEGG